MRLKLVVQYDGHGLRGWQAQAGLPTVQGLMQEALRQLLGEPALPHGLPTVAGGDGVALSSPAPRKGSAGQLVAAGRTDAGVHAWGQVCHVDVDKGLPIARYQTGMNRFLPHSIRVVGVAAVDDGFHARYSARARHYVYRLWNARQLRPDLLGHAGHVPLPLDMDAMAAACADFPLGKNDFSGFRDADCQSRTPVCALHSLRWMEEGGGIWRLEVSADHFLHHMVRNIMGTLVEIGQGKRGAGGLVEVLEGRDRAKAGTTFMPDGLYLAKVDY